MNFQSFSNLEFLLDFCQIYAGIVWLLEWCMHEPSTALLLSFFFPSNWVFVFSFLLIECVFYYYKVYVGLKHHKG